MGKGWDEEVGAEGMALKGVSYLSILLSPSLCFLVATDGQIFFLSTMKLFLSSDPETAKRLWTETSETMTQDRTLS